MIPAVATAYGFNTGSSCPVGERSRLSELHRQLRARAEEAGPLRTAAEQPSSASRRMDGDQRVVQSDNRVLVGLSFMFLAVCLLNMIGLLLAKFLGAGAPGGIASGPGRDAHNDLQQHLVEVAVIGVAAACSASCRGAGSVRRAHQLRQLRRADAARRHDGLLPYDRDCFGHDRGTYPTWRVCRMQPAKYLKTQ